MSSRRRKAVAPSPGVGSSVVSSRMPANRVAMVAVPIHIAQLATDGPHPAASQSARSATTTKGVALPRPPPSLPMSLSSSVGVVGASTLSVDMRSLSSHRRGGWSVKGQPRLDEAEPVIDTGRRRKDEQQWQMKPKAYVMPTNTTAATAAAGVQPLTNPTEGTPPASSPTPKDHTILARTDATKALGLHSDTATHARVHTQIVHAASTAAAASAAASASLQASQASTAEVAPLLPSSSAASLHPSSSTASFVRARGMSKQSSAAELEARFTHSRHFDALSVPKREKPLTVPVILLRREEEEEEEQKQHEPTHHHAQTERIARSSAAHAAALAAAPSTSRLVYDAEFHTMQQVSAAIPATLTSDASRHTLHPFSSTGSIAATGVPAAAALGDGGSTIYPQASLEKHFFAHEFSDAAMSAVAAARKAGDGFHPGGGASSSLHSSTSASRSNLALPSHLHSITATTMAPSASAGALPFGMSPSPSYDNLRTKHSLGGHVASSPSMPRFMGSQSHGGGGQSSMASLTASGLSTAPSLVDLAAAYPAEHTIDNSSLVARYLREMIREKGYKYRARSDAGKGGEQIIQGDMTESNEDDDRPRRMTKRKATTTTTKKKKQAAAACRVAEHPAVASGRRPGGSTLSHGYPRPSWDRAGLDSIRDAMPFDGLFAGVESSPGAGDRRRSQKAKENHQRRGHQLTQNEDANNTSGGGGGGCGTKELTKEERRRSGRAALDVDSTASSIAAADQRRKSNEQKDAGVAVAAGGGLSILLDGHSTTRRPSLSQRSLAADPLHPHPPPTLLSAAARVLLRKETNPPERNANELIVAQVKVEKKQPVAAAAAPADTSSAIVLHHRRVGARAKKDQHLADIVLAKAHQADEDFTNYAGMSATAMMLHDSSSGGQGGADAAMLHLEWNGSSSGGGKSKGNLGDAARKVYNSGGGVLQLQSSSATGSTALVKHAGGGSTARRAVKSNMESWLRVRMRRHQRVLKEEDRLRAREMFDMLAIAAGPTAHAHGGSGAGGSIGAGGGSTSLRDPAGATIELEAMRRALRNLGMDTSTEELAFRLQKLSEHHAAVRANVQAGLVSKLTPSSSSSSSTGAQPQSLHLNFADFLSIYEHISQWEELETFRHQQRRKKEKIIVGGTPGAGGTEGKSGPGKRTVNPANGMSASASETDLSDGGDQQQQQQQHTFLRSSRSKAQLAVLQQRREKKQKRKESQQPMETDPSTAAGAADNAAGGVGAVPPILKASPSGRLRTIGERSKPSKATGTGLAALPGFADLPPGSFGDDLTELQAALTTRTDETLKKIELPFFLWIPAAHRAERINELVRQYGQPSLVGVGPGFEDLVGKDGAPVGGASGGAGGEGGPGGLSRSMSNTSLASAAATSAARTARMEALATPKHVQPKVGNSSVTNTPRVLTNGPSSSASAAAASFALKSPSYRSPAYSSRRSQPAANGGDASGEDSDDAELAAVMSKDKGDEEEETAVAEESPSSMRMLNLVDILNPGRVILPVVPGAVSSSASGGGSGVMVPGSGVTVSPTKPKLARRVSRALVPNSSDSSPTTPRRGSVSVKNSVSGPQAGPYWGSSQVLRALHYKNMSLSSSTLQTSRVLTHETVAPGAGASAPSPTPTHANQPPSTPGGTLGPLPPKTPRQVTLTVDSTARTTPTPRSGQKRLHSPGSSSKRVVFVSPLPSPSSGIPTFSPTHSDYPPAITIAATPRAVPLSGGGVVGGVSSDFLVAGVDMSSLRRVSTPLQTIHESLHAKADAHAREVAELIRKVERNLLAQQDGGGTVVEEGEEEEKHQEAEGGTSTSTSSRRGSSVIPDGVDILTIRDHSDGGGDLAVAGKQAPASSSTSARKESKFLSPSASLTASTGRASRRRSLITDGGPNSGETIGPTVPVLAKGEIAQATIPPHTMADLRAADKLAAEKSNAGGGAGEKSSSSSSATAIDDHPEVMPLTDPIVKAAKSGAWEDVLMLIQTSAGDNVKLRNAYVNRRDKNGSTAIFHCVWLGHFKVLEVLLYHGADPNVQNNRLNTALHLCCEKGHRKLIRLLVEMGASIDLRNWQNKTCIDVIPVEEVEADDHQHAGATKLIVVPAGSTPSTEPMRSAAAITHAMRHHAAVDASDSLKSFVHECAAEAKKKRDQEKADATHNGLGTVKALSSSSASSGLLGGAGGVGGGGPHSTAFSFAEFSSRRDRDLAASQAAAASAAASLSLLGPDGKPAVDLWELTAADRRSAGLRGNFFGADTLQKGGQEQQRTLFTGQLLIHTRESAKGLTANQNAMGAYKESFIRLMHEDPVTLETRARIVAGLVREELQHSSLAQLWQKTLKTVQQRATVISSTEDLLEQNGQRMDQLRGDRHQQARQRQNEHHQQQQTTDTGEAKGTPPAPASAEGKEA